MNFISILLMSMLACTIDTKTTFSKAQQPLDSFNETTANVDTKIARKIAQLALVIGHQLQTPTTVNNLLYSPVNIAGALALLMLGSKGKTFKELAPTLASHSYLDAHPDLKDVHEHFGKSLALLGRTSDYGEQIKLATGVFVQNDFPIRSEYKEVVESTYKSEVSNLDFKKNAAGARDFINSWISSKTNSKITDMIRAPPPDTTKVIVTSALYFKAAWENPFFDGTIYTTRRKFYTNGRNMESNIFVDTMWNSGSFPYYKDTYLDCEIMGLPYKGNRTTMYVIVPRASTIGRLQQLEARLTPSDLDRLIASTKYKYFNVLFPKMKLEGAIDLKATLQSLGVKSLFIPGEANLGLLARGEISKELIARTGHNNAGGDLRTAVNLSNRFPVDCTATIDSNGKVHKCQDTNENTFDDKEGLRTSRQTIVNSTDNLRSTLNTDPNDVENPGLYVDKVLHKVYMDVTETGTEAAAVTAVYLDKFLVKSFDVNVPFLFFIRHEETQLILFWGTVRTPTPYFN